MVILLNEFEANCVLCDRYAYNDNSNFNARLFSNLTRLVKYIMNIKRKDLIDYDEYNLINSLISLIACKVIVRAIAPPIRRG